MMLLWLLACAPEEEEVLTQDPCAPGEPATLEIGKGERSYAPMESDDGVVQLVHGPQGGFHVVISLRATYLDDSRPVVVHMTGEVEGEKVADVMSYLTFRCNGTDRVLEAWGALLLFDATPEELDGRELLISATAMDAVGTVVTASTTALIIDPNL